MVASSINAVGPGAGVGVGVGVGLGLGWRRRRLAKADDGSSKEVRPPVITAALPLAVVRKNSRRLVGLFPGSEGSVIVVGGYYYEARQQQPGHAARRSLPRKECNKFGGCPSQFDNPEIFLDA